MERCPSTTRRRGSLGVPIRGFSLLEALVALLGLFLVVQGGWSVLSTLRRTVEAAQEATEGLETVRTVDWILGEELEGERAGTDWRLTGSDSVTLRAFRGLALLRLRKRDGTVLVCYTGIRNPNPEKDSLLVLREGEGWQPLDLQSRVAGEEGCWDGSRGREEAWVVEGEEEDAPWYLARVFERGSYHLADGAFRYRAGGGGRQPLTLPNVQEGGFSQGGIEAGGLFWWLELRSSRGGEGSAWRGWGS